MLRRLLPIAGFLCYLGIFGTGAAGAQALPMDRCSTSSGVVVAVDFGPWHGPIVRGCGSTPTRGIDLITEGGFSTVLVRGEPFVCRIGYSGFGGGTQYPTGANCGYTPPSNAYWSYWNADPGKHSWTFSTQGAYDSYPVAGAVQAWTFGNGGYPSFSPDSVRAQNKAPASASPTSKASTPASSPAVGSIRGVSSQPTVASRTTGRPISQAAASTARRPVSSPPSRTSSAVASLAAGSAAPSTSPNIVDAQPDSATRPQSSGSALPVLAAGAIVLALAGLAGFTAWHRRAG